MKKRSPHASTGLVFRKLVDFERVGIRTSCCLRQSEQLRSEPSHWHWSCGVLGDVDHGVEILEHGSDMAERGRMNALRHSRYKQLQRDRIRKTARQCLRQSVRVDAGVDREPRRLCEYRHRTADDYLVT